VPRRSRGAILRALPTAWYFALLKISLAPQIIGNSEILRTSHEQKVAGGTRLLRISLEISATVDVRTIRR
jgi:hypothetical protein